MEYLQLVEGQVRNGLLVRFAAQKAYYLFRE